MLLVLACTASGPDSTGETDHPVDTSSPWEAPVVVVNEFMADNATTVVLDDGSSPDWVELYNAGKDMSLEGWGLSDTPGEPHKQVLSGALGAGEFRLVTLEFGLSADGEQVGLYAAGGAALDVVVFGPQTEDVAAARSPDGGPDWVYVGGGTPGAANE